MQVSSTLIPDGDIICFSLSRWDGKVSSPAKSIARELSKSRRVFFIEHPYSYKDFIKERKASRTYQEEGVTVITPPLVYPINFLPEGRMYNYFSGLNNQIMERTLRAVIQKNNITHYIFINFFDPFFLREIPADIRPDLFVYQCMDDLSQVAYTSRHGVQLEEKIIRHADVTLCTSIELTRLKSAFSKQVYFHPNAADIALFNKAFHRTFRKPPDMDFPGKKIIGFLGSIDYRTDFDLLEAVGLYHHDKIIYLIGPVAGKEYEAVSRLPNVVFAGARKLSELPAYVQYFDCAIIPYKINVLTKSIYPLKINEYLAAGKPVIATSFSEDIQTFRDTAYIAGSTEEFIALIDTVIADDDLLRQQVRVASVASNSWVKRVAELWVILDRVLKGKLQNA